MRLMHNLASLSIYKEHLKNISINARSSEKISSGEKIKSAKDDPYALAAKERFTMQLRGLQMSQRNIQDGVSMVQAADANLQGVEDSLQKMRELSVRMKSGSLSPTDLEVAFTEFKTVASQVDTGIKNSEFNKTNLVSNTAVVDNSKPIDLSIQINANVGDKLSLPTYNLNTSTLGTTIDGTSVSIKDLTENFDADKAVKVLDASIETISSIRSKYGAVQTTLENRYEASYTMYNKTQEAQSSISDSDIAKEMIEVSRTQLLLEAGTALMAQSNNFPRDILRILENVRS